MNRLIVILTLFSCNDLFAQKKYVESFHDGSAQFTQGYYSFEDSSGYQLLDVSGNNRHGFTGGSVKFIWGRKNCFYPDPHSVDCWRDTTGETRTALDLHGGYGQVDGVPFNSLKNFDKKIRSCCYAKVNPSGHGILYSWGDSLKGNGVVVRINFDSITQQHSLEYLFLESHLIRSRKSIPMLTDNWVYLELDLKNMLSTSKIDNCIEFYCLSDYDNIANHYLKMTAESMSNLRTALPLDMGLCGSIAFGKNLFTGEIFNSGIAIDDFYLSNNFLYFDPTNEVVNIPNFGIEISPNPCTTKLIVTDKYNALNRVGHNYKIFSSDGKLIDNGDLNTEINVAKLKSGVYQLVIGGFSMQFVKE